MHGLLPRVFSLLVTSSRIWDTSTPSRKWKTFGMSSYRKREAYPKKKGITIFQTFTCIFSLQMWLLSMPLLWASKEGNCPPLQQIIRKKERFDISHGPSILWCPCCPCQVHDSMFFICKSEAVSCSIMFTVDDKQVIHHCLFSRGDKLTASIMSPDIVKHVWYGFSASWGFHYHPSMLLKALSLPLMINSIQKQCSSEPRTSLLQFEISLSESLIKTYAYWGLSMISMIPDTIIPPQNTLM